MITYISILRGINVGGKRRILMADLIALYESIGFKDVRTYIQSGNVFFKSNDKNVKDISLEIEKGIHEKYGFEVPVIIRTEEEIAKLNTTNTFLKNNALEHLHCVFLSEEPLMENVSKMNDKVKELNSKDKFIIVGKDVFLCCTGKYSDCKFSNTFFEKQLKVVATTRNWKTMQKLQEIAISL